MTFHGHNRRSEKPGRREEDYTTCPFHEGTCSDIKALETTMMPRWVVIWVGGPVVAALLGLGLWNATRGISASERLVKLEVTQEVMVSNQEKLMQHFNITPSKTIKQ